MEIIERGIPQKERKWKGVCRACKSVAIASEHELKNITFDQRENSSFAWEICPVCKAGETAGGYGGMIFYPKK